MKYTARFYRKYYRIERAGNLEKIQRSTADIMIKIAGLSEAALWLGAIFMSFS
jgi:hypothetical protein